MDQAVSNVIRFAGLDLPSVMQMAGQNGSKLFSELEREIVPGCPADLVLFEHLEKIVAHSTWVLGEEIVTR